MSERRTVGRPPSKSVRMWLTVMPETDAKLNRLAKSMGLVKRNGGPPYIGAVVDKIVQEIKTQEPEYLKLAKREVPA